MFSKLIGKMTYANVMSTFAVFIALSGAAYAGTQLAKKSVGTRQLKDGAVTGQKVKDNSLTGADIDASTLGNVPNATHADSATSATSATAAASAAEAAHAKDADTLGGKSASQFAPAQDEGWHEVGTPNEPPLESNWVNVGGSPNVNQGVFSTAAFRRDPYGYVHLKGIVKEGIVSGTSRIFILPAGFLPEQAEVFATATSSGIGNLYLGATGSPYQGAVIPFSGGNGFFSIDGLTFRCGPSGVDGCP